MRTAYRSIELYDPRRAPCAVDLSDNTNLFGAPPAVGRALADLGEAAVTRYPSVYADGLKAALARRHGVEPENVVTGCGSDDLIDSAVRAFCDPGDPLAYPEPTFGIVGTFARMNAARPVAVPQDGGITLDVESLIRVRAPITYVCTPNNPTGATVDRESLAELDSRLGGVLLLDEAYADFAEGRGAGPAADSARTVSLRTLSKAYGLAGLRVGYAVGPAELVREVEKSRGPYKVSAVAEAVALAVLAEDAAWVAATVATVQENRARLAAELQARGVRITPSQANFLLVGLPERLPADILAGRLREEGVAVRPFPGLTGLGDCVRVTVGPWPMMTAFLAALDAALAREAT